MKILHLVTHDKFTEGYINFMKICLKEYEHIFLVSAYSCSDSENVDGRLIDASNVIFYHSGKWLAFSKEIKSYIFQADKIIVSGMFGIERLIFFWPSKAFNKMYIQYWGGDFYQLREKISVRRISEWMQRKMLVSCMKRSKGAIFLLDSEYLLFKEITKIEKQIVYTAVVPYNPLTRFPYEKYRNKNKSDVVRILIGNSATIENGHIEALYFLKHLKNEHIEVFVPLSYGDSDYAHDVVLIGREIFGSKFHPIFEWMSENDYFTFLSTMDIGVFNNNRQQGMGNIAALLRMGKKVYLRFDTTMYSEYRKLGFVCYDIFNLQSETIEELVDFPYKEKNEIISDDWNTPNSMTTQWQYLLDM